MSPFQSHSELGLVTLVWPFSIINHDFLTQTVGIKVYRAAKTLPLASVCWSRILNNMDWGIFRARALLPKDVGAEIVSVRSRRNASWSKFEGRPAESGHFSRLEDKKGR